MTNTGGGQDPSTWIPPGALPTAAAPRRRRRPLRWIGGAAGGFVVLAIVLGAVAGQKQPTTNNYVPPAPAAAAATPTTLAAATTTTAPIVLLNLTGNGADTSQPFTVAGGFTLAYNFSCSSFGSAGNFAVTVEDPSGDPVATPVNALATSGQNSTYVPISAGTYVVSVDSECDWAIRAIS